MCVREVLGSYGGKRRGRFAHIIKEKKDYLHVRYINEGLVEEELFKGTLTFERNTSNALTPFGKVRYSFLEDGKLVLLPRCLAMVIVLSPQGKPIHLRPFGHPVRTITDFWSNAELQELPGGFVSVVLEPALHDIDPFVDNFPAYNVIVSALYGGTYLEKVVRLSEFLINPN